MMKIRLLLVPALLAGALAACSDEPTGPACTAPRVAIPALTGDTVRTDSGLQFIVRAQGSGEVAQPTSTVVVNYTGYLRDGTLFDQGTGIEFQLTGVIEGFTEGIAGMREGGSRRLIIPPSLGYGAVGPTPCIPGNATLIFDVDLVEVR
jgi:FKBP-type peptidyl-prolyl cis-trans isomerase